MPAFLWWLLGIAALVLVLYFVLLHKYGDEPVWEEITPDEAPPHSPIHSVEAGQSGQNNGELEGQENANSWRGELGVSTPADNIRSNSGSDARRSSRIDRAVPLVILGTNKLGQSFLEETSAVSLNLHGCRYPSRHEYPIESWVTLQVTGTEGRAHAPVVRARVRSILSARNPRELCQVGVEFETPGNVWGIDAPPDDWQGALGRVHATTPSGAAVAPARETAELPAPLLQPHATPPERRAEVTMFPTPTPSPVPPDRVQEAAPGKPERVVVTSEQLVNALQGKLQQAADKAVENAVAKHLEDALRKALERIEEVWKTNVRQTEQYSAARIGEVQNRAEEQLGTYRGRAEEIAERLELLINSARTNLSEMQKFVERVTRELEPQLNARLNESYGRASNELENVAAQISERQFANFTESTQAVMREALTQLEERVAGTHTLIEGATNSPGYEQIESLVNSAKEETQERLEARLLETRGQWEEQQELQRKRMEEIAQKLEKFAENPVPDSGHARTHAEQAVGELEPQIYARLEESVVRATKDLESAAERNNTEMLGRMEARLQLARSEWQEQQELLGNRLEEIAQILEKMATSPAPDLGDTRKYGELAVRELEPQISAKLDESVEQATKDFETAAARVADRQLVRLMEEKQRVAREASLEIEAGATEARALLQKASNVTLDEFRRQVEIQIDLGLSEATQRMSSSLASLDAENQAACDERRRALENDVAQAAEQSTQEFRSGIKAFLYSCLVAAVSAVDVHAQTTLNGLGNSPLNLSHELMPSPEPTGILGEKSSAPDGDNSK